MAGYKPNLAVNRAIRASDERGVDVPLPGGMRPLGTRPLAAPHIGAVKPPRIPSMRGTRIPKPHIAGRKYYGE